ncbi:hypothetical protein K438DRAFT_2067941 [Mycena galopus ATCC 62051]|nr:hypothetical protein K438DRAFT_2067941 [Mycena galopus ATCC 62051]
MPRTAPTSPFPSPVNLALVWSDSAGYLLGGNGWAPGSSENFQFWTDLSGDGGNSSLSFYGWTTDPLVKYHIVEDLSAFQADRFASLVVAGTSGGKVRFKNRFEDALGNPNVFCLAPDHTLRKWSGHIMTCNEDSDSQNQQFCRFWK